MNATSTEATSIGVDVGGTKILSVALSPTGTILARKKIPTPQEIDSAAGKPVGSSVAAAVAESVAMLAAEVGLSPTTCALGLGVPGMVDHAGTLVFAPNLHGAIGANIAHLVGERLNRAEVGVDNDANCAAVAEHHFGAARGVDHALLVTLGTGIGGAAIINGQLLRGANGFAGEFGHLMVDPTGPECPCGGKGCLERYASGAGLRHLATEAAANGKLSPSAAESPEALFSAAQRDESDARAVVDQFCWWLARGIANLCACFDPELVLLGGGVLEGHEIVLGPTAHYLATELEGGSHRTPPRVDVMALGSDAGAVGAALLGERTKK
ncbi:MAG: ROK family protein [Actinomycetota bacterium]